jgi:hypothetical protein
LFWVFGTYIFMLLLRKVLTSSHIPKQRLRRERRNKYSVFLILSLALIKMFKAKGNHWCLCIEFSAEVRNGNSSCNRRDLTSICSERGIGESRPIELQILLSSACVMLPEKSCAPWCDCCFSFLPARAPQQFGNICTNLHCNWTGILIYSRWNSALIITPLCICTL